MLSFKPIALLIRVLAHTGHGSYSLYILHYPLLLLLVGTGVSLAPAAIVVLGLVLATPHFEKMLVRATVRMPIFRDPVSSVRQT